ncbi:hypothetical protein Cni_G25636 [Canna indica]|uniref:KIB1-4 beta-propeller domain-containing protein n=1 Tax=Canna indica TaxID=4628 RepID=A0AAQ3KXC9_9LILI|nr:hypothetical protein Cni_G25636 [Canna indica]
MKQRCWSELPPELIHAISAKTTDIADYIRLRAVCKPWRSATIPSTFTQQLIPWLMLPYNPESSSRSFFSLSSHKTFSFNLPQLRGKLTYGSPHGWLVMVDKAFDVALFNPISGCFIQLPAITRFPDFSTFHFDRHGDEFVYRRRAGVSGKVNYDMIWHILFCCVFTSSSSPRGADGDYLVTITSCLSPRFLCYRSVDKAWTLVDSTLTCGVDSLTRYNDKMFLVGIDGNTVVCDVYPQLRAEIVSSLRVPRDFHCCYFGTVGAKLLLVLMTDSMKKLVGDEGKKKEKINIFELDLDDEQLKKKKKKKRMRWVKVEDTGDWTLVLTENNYQFSASAARRGALGYRGDYVSFRAVRREVDEKHVKMEVLQMEEEGCRVLPCDWVTEMEALGPAWFAPALV